MKIFISWSGQRSEALAKALHTWFPIVLHYADPWLSQSDIHAGERWGIEVAKNLEECNFGIICITKENLNAPWILFEAGALAKSMQDGRVIPLLLDLEFKEISGPLAQFQAKKVENAGLKELILSLNKVASSPIPDERLEKLFGLSWDDFETQISKIPASASSKHSRPQGEILEELVSSVRNVEMRFRDIFEDDSLKRRKKSRRYSSMMLDMAERIGDGPEDPTRLLFISSLFRDDLPWLYEMTLEAYRSLKSGQPEEALRAQRKLCEVVELLARGPFIEECGLDHRLVRLLHEVMAMLERPSFNNGKSDSAANGVRHHRRLVAKGDEL